MIARKSALRVQNLAAQFPIVVITGARQTGKTTLIRSLYPDYPYFNLERPDTLARLMDDPLGVLKSLPQGCGIIDEAQRFPELPSWLQVLVDEDPRPGRIFLTGSNQPLLKSQVNQSLAGRAAYVNLHPFSQEELGALSTDFTDFSHWLFKGFYPPLYDRPFEPLDWFAQYVQTYLERDLTQLIQVKNWQSFHRFLKLCAGRTGQVLNLSDLARDTDVSHTTIKHWLSVLEASYLIFLLPPWHSNYNKRLVKSPKLYFYDVGLAGHLAGISEKSQWESHPLQGAFFESLVVAELVKRRSSRALSSNWYFWSSPSGMEIDLIEERGQDVRAYEIKSTATFRPQQVQHLLAWADLARVPQEHLFLLNNGDETLRYRGVSVCPWWKSP